VSSEIYETPFHIPTATLVLVGARKVVN